MRRGAVITVDLRYRYTLTRAWDELRPTDVWIMLNPSTADAEIDDPTIRRCIGFSARWGSGRIVVVNLFALRSTDPKVLALDPDPIGPENDAAIALAVTLSRRAGGRVVAAWGSHQMAEVRGRHVADLVGGPLYCLGRTSSGAPRHPLYVRGATDPVLWRRSS